ncbi:MAG: ABC transporter permease [Planctomycetota bacterium]|nr:ABC transporter permease [Planctomycetota bacterium]
MIRIALQMLVGGRAKYLSLVLGITVTAFLVTYAASFFCGMMTRSFAMIGEIPAADVWIMDPAIECVDQTIDMRAGSLGAVRSVNGVRWAVPLLLANAEVRFPDGRFLPVQVIGVDDATLVGAPLLEGGQRADLLRMPDAAIIADGGTIGKLETSITPIIPGGQPNMDGDRRPLAVGDELTLNDFHIRVVGTADATPRYPPRPLVYMTYSNALRVLPIERRRLTFVLAAAGPGVEPGVLADRIAARTGLRARTSEDFKADTVWWFLMNSEDVGDVETMLSIAMIVGLGVTGVMLFLFTQDNLRYYAVLKAMGCTPRWLVLMVLAQGGLCALLGMGLGLGICVASSSYSAWAGVPFRMMWFTPLVGGAAVLVVTAVAAAISVWPVIKLDPGAVFTFR